MLVLLTVSNGVRYGQEVGLERIEAEAPQAQTQVLLHGDHGELERDAENVEWPRSVSLQCNSIRETD